MPEPKIRGDKYFTVECNTCKLRVPTSDLEASAICHVCFTVIPLPELALEAGESWRVEVRPPPTWPRRLPEGVIFPPDPNFDDPTVEPLPLERAGPLPLGVLSVFFSASIIIFAMGADSTALSNSLGSCSKPPIFVLAASVIFSFIMLLALMPLIIKWLAHQQSDFFTRKLIQIIASRSIFSQIWSYSFLANSLSFAICALFFPMWLMLFYTPANMIVAVTVFSIPTWLILQSIIAYYFTTVGARMVVEQYYTAGSTNSTSPLALTPNWAFSGARSRIWSLINAGVIIVAVRLGMFGGIVIGLFVLLLPSLQLSTIAIGGAAWVTILWILLFQQVAGEAIDAGILQVVHAAVSRSPFSAQRNPIWEIFRPHTYTTGVYSHASTTTVHICFALMGGLFGAVFAVIPSLALCASAPMVLYLAPAFGCINGMAMAWITAAPLLGGVNALLYCYGQYPEPMARSFPEVCALLEAAAEAPRIAATTQSPRCKVGSVVSAPPTKLKHVTGASLDGYATNV